MNRFAALYDALDATTSTNAKVAAMVAYFADAPPEDAAWGLYFLTGQRPKRLIPAASLRAWAGDIAQVPPWLFDESYNAVGDIAETIALLIEATAGSSPAGELSLSRWMTERILPLRNEPEPAQRALVCAWWHELDTRGVYVLCKLLTGALRVGVSATLVIRALARFAGLEPQAVAHRLMGTWQPTAEFFRAVVATSAANDDASQPYPFYLASPLEQPASGLGPREQWQVEWKWDGIRAQLIRRGGAVYLWSRGEELITERFPELEQAAKALPEGSVFDGEVLAYRDAAPMPFAVLQRRIGRRTLGPKILAEAPVVFMGYDVLEWQGSDKRTAPLAERRALLERYFNGTEPRFVLSPALSEPTWEALADTRGEARARGVEGFMLKRLDSPYGVGRKRGDWWKWKIDPYSIDAVLIYAQAGHGRRASLFTDYTFAVWSEGVLVPVAKAYSGLTDVEIASLDKWIRANTREKFGPVRSVEPVHVFELAFEGIQESPRHKSGIAFRFPRIARWRTDKAPADADTLDRVKGLLRAPR